MPSADLSGIHIIGAGGLGRDFIACFRGELKIAGFWDDKIPVGDIINHYPVLGAVTELLNIPDSMSVIIAAGNPAVRKQIADLIGKSHHQFATIVHSSVRLFDEQRTFLGQGCVIFPGVHITTGVTIGKNSIIHSCCSLHHDTRIGSNCMIMPGTICAGNVEIGNEVYVGPQRAFTYGTIIKSGERCE